MGVTEPRGAARPEKCECPPEAFGRLRDMQPSEPPARPSNSNAAVGIGGPDSSSSDDSDSVFRRLADQARSGAGSAQDLCCAQARAVFGRCSKAPQPARRYSISMVLTSPRTTSVREAVRRLLHRAGMHVIAACNGAEALEILGDVEHVDVLMTCS